MAKMREIGSAFLDGLGSLAFLFERPVRPGSHEDLIDSSSTSEVEQPYVPRTVSEHAAKISVAAQLRAVADRLETQAAPEEERGLEDALAEARRSLARLRAEHLRAERLKARTDPPAADSLHAL